MRPVFFGRKTCIFKSCHRFWHFGPLVTEPYSVVFPVTAAICREALQNFTNGEASQFINASAYFLTLPGYLRKRLSAFFTFLLRNRKTSVIVNYLTRSSFRSLLRGNLLPNSVGKYCDPYPTNNVFTPFTLKKILMVFAGTLDPYHHESKRENNVCSWRKFGAREKFLC